MICSTKNVSLFRTSVTRSGSPSPCGASDGQGRTAPSDVCARVAGGCRPLMCSGFQAPGKHEPTVSDLGFRQADAPSDGTTPQLHMTLRKQRGLRKLHFLTCPGGRSQATPPTWGGLQGRGGQGSGICGGSPSSQAWRRAFNSGGLS